MKRSVACVFMALAAAASAQVKQQDFPGKPKGGSIPKSNTLPRATPETPEHTLARENLESIRRQCSESKSDFDKAFESEPLRDGEKRCQLFPVAHPISMQESDHKSVGCRYETRKYRYVMESMAEELELYEARLAQVDECKSIYDATIDKKMSDQTMREAETVKRCQSMGQYPPKKK